MSDAETRLAEFWSQTEAPARDLVFELNVQQRIASRRVAIDAAGLGGALLLAACVLVAMGPSLAAAAGGLVTSFDAVGPSLAAAAMIGLAMSLFARRPDEA